MSLPAVLRLDPRSGQPLYRQLAGGLRAAIQRSELRPGHRLPSSRQLARSLGVSRITVSQAYELLQAEGLLEGRVGRGTFVAAQPGPPWTEARPEAPRLSPRPGVPPVGAPLAWVRELLQEARRPGVISFAEGGPPADWGPAEGLRVAVEQVMGQEGAAVFGYEAADGYWPLREALAGFLQTAGQQADPEDILVTAGTQQAIYLAVSRLAQPGEAVLVERPTFVGALRVMEERGLRLLEVGLDGQGLQPAEVDALARRQPLRLLYVQPTYHNPTGQTLAAERRQRLIRLSAEQGLPVLEDAAYQALAVEAAPPPALRALAGGPETVIHVSSFSQFLAPGLRLGYMVVPPAWREALQQAREVLDLHSPGLIQRAVHRYLSTADWRADLAAIRARLRERHQAMVEALDTYLAGAARWQPPAGGLFFWLELPEGEDAAMLAVEALEEGVAFAPGSLFYAGGGGRNALRLNYSLQPPEACRQGIARLARAMERRTARPAPTPSRAAVPVL